MEPERAPCLAARDYLTKNEEQPVSECLPRGSPQVYIPMSRIETFFDEELKVQSVFLCPCGQCLRDGGPLDDRVTNFNSRREQELKTEYAATFALLIYIQRPGLIRIFQKHELRLHDTRYLFRENFDVLRKENVIESEDVIKQALRHQYSILVRTLKPSSDIIEIPAKELLPINEDQEPKGSGSFAEVRCFEFQSEEYRSKDFGHITRFARKIFKQPLKKSAAKEWNNLQNLSKSANHEHLMAALGAFWHGNYFFILQEEAEMSLHDYLRGKGDAYDPHELWNQMCGIANGLAILHQLHKGTKIAYHQDLKPANILIVRRIMKIADFGLLEFKPVSLDDTGTTGVASHHNTGFYAAPRTGRYTREDDIWSLACIFSEAATSDVQGRDEVAKYKDARIGEGASKDVPKFHMSGKVKSQVLERHKQLQSILETCTTADRVDERRSFQTKFYNQSFFTFLNSMFRYRGISTTYLEVPDHIDFDVPDAGKIAETIEGMRKEATPTPSLGAGEPTFCASEGLVPALDATLDEHFGLKYKRIFQDSTSNDLKQFVANLQARQVAEGRQQGFKRLAPLIDALEQYGQLLEELCEVTHFMPCIWGPIQFVLDRASSNRDALNEVLNMYKQIGLAQPLRSQYKEIIRTQPEMDMILSETYNDIVRIHKLTLTFFEQRRWEELFLTTWMRHKSQCFTHIAKMANRLDLVTHRGSAIQFATFQNSGAKEDEELRVKMESEDLKRKQVIYTWLKAFNMQNEQDHFAKVRNQYPTTGSWLSDHTTFKEWLDPQFPVLPPLLWIHGNPGAGKTILASMVVEEAMKLSPTIILFFYFKQDESDRDNFASMARTLLSQLLMQCPGLLDYIYDKCCNSGEALLSARGLMDELLSFALENCDSAYIVLDGLDECCSREERKTIVEFFRNLIENLDPDPDRLHCLFVSRKDSARKDFHGLANIGVGSEFNEDDIDAFGQVQSRNLGRKLGVSETRLEEIAIFVSAFAQGIFLVAELVWANLCSQTSINGLEEEMRSLPTELDRLEKAYSRIMHTIRNKLRAEREGALMLLSWLVCAKRPLKFHEVQTMKSINLDQRTVEFEQGRFRVHPKDLCESLVDVRPDGSIELVHLTAKSYLSKNKDVDIAEEEIKFATLCIDYLNLPCFIRPFAKETVLDGNYGFMEYALLNWVRHLEAGLSSGSDREGLMAEFFESIETLLENHWNNPIPVVKVPKRTREILAIFNSSQKHEEIQQAIASTQDQAKRLGDIRPGECALDFIEVVAGIRQQLEAVVIETEATDTSRQEDLKLKYGTNLFKCSRFSCKYFTYGFETRGERDRHLERHERPARCTDIHCTGFKIGFATKAQLAKHLRETHSETTGQDQLFPTEEEIEQSLRSPDFTPEPEEVPIVVLEQPTVVEQDPEPQQETQADSAALPARSSRPAKRAKVAQEYDCSFCGKNFGKKFNWESHLKTHGPSESFTCDVCGTVCARKNDLDRHKRKHTGSDDFICGVLLLNGQSWGCGKSFLRADILRNHHKSKKGQKCLAGLTEEEQVQITGP